MKLTLQKSDNIGIVVSTLCMIHCIITPFLFIVQTCSATCCEATPLWWKWMDYLFVTISFFAIRRSSQNSTNKFIKIGLWLSWVVLMTVIINESIGYFMLSENYKYIAAFSLIGFHLYNLKYCQCKNDKCCIHHE